MIAHASMCSSNTALKRNILVYDETRGELKTYVLPSSRRLPLVDNILTNQNQTLQNTRRSQLQACTRLAWGTTADSHPWWIQLKEAALTNQSALAFSRSRILVTQLRSLKSSCLCWKSKCQNIAMTRQLEGSCLETVIVYKARWTIPANTLS